MLFLEDPDSQIEEIKKSLQFITSFCIQSNLQLYQYPRHKTADLYTWMVHYKQNKINPYTMMEFQNVYSSLHDLTTELQQFYVSNFVEQYKNLYIKYSNSKVVKPFLKEKLPILSKFIEKQLTNNVYQR